MIVNCKYKKRKLWLMISLSACYLWLILTLELIRTGVKGIGDLIQALNSILEGLQKAAEIAKTDAEKRLIEEHITILRKYPTEESEWTPELMAKAEKEFREREEAMYR